MSPPDARAVRDAQVTASYYDGHAPLYDAKVDGQPANRRLRDAFRGRVLAGAERDGPILDFGCGTGTDALWYAGAGRRVIAYDISESMLAVLRDRCAAEIAIGTVAPVSGPLERLIPELARAAPIAAIAANFAVLSHVHRPGPLLRTLARYLEPGGSIVASLLNPFCVSDMRRRWWWRAAIRAPFTGSVRLDGAVTTYRHLESSMRRSVRPQLELTSWESTSEIADGRRRNAVRRRLSSGFVFATFRKST